jgi:PIN domain
MANPRACVETTIPSFYHETRLLPDIIARRDWTRLWWSDAADRYELVTSAVVLAELANGPSDRSSSWLALVREVALVAVEPAIAEIVEVYSRHRLMATSPGDSLHLALASYHKCDFLVKWNCRHLANANKFGHIRRVNSMLGLFTQALVTPLELLGVSDESGPE